MPGLASFLASQPVQACCHEPLAARNIIHVERGGRFRVRERTVLKYYARTIEHLLVTTGRTH